MRITRRLNRPGNPGFGDCCSRAGKPQVHRKGEAATRPCEVHATIRLPKGKRINIDKALVSLLDDLKCGVEQVDAIFIRFVRGEREG